MKGKLLQLRPGEVLFNEGDPSNKLYIIKDGQVEIFRVRDNSDVVLGKLGARDVIGTVTLLSRKPRTASARAVTEAKVFAVSPQMLMQELKPFPVWVQVIIKDTVARLMHVDDKLVESRLETMKLQRRVGTPLTQLGQFVHLILMYSGAQPSAPEGGDNLFATDSFLETAEKVLRFSNRQLKKFYSTLVAAGFLSEKSREEVGMCFQVADADRLLRFANFSQAMSRREKMVLLTEKYPGVLEALAKVVNSHAKEQGWYTKELLETFAAVFESVKDNMDEVIEEFEREGVFEKAEYPPESVQFEQERIGDRVEFEGVMQGLEESSG